MKPFHGIAFGVGTNMSPKLKTAKTVNIATRVQTTIDYCTKTCCSRLGVGTFEQTV